MYKKFMQAQAQEVDLGDWVVDEDIAQKLRGKIRTLSLRVALPPAPLCPETTGMEVTYHVYATESRIVLETTSVSWMSLIVKRLPLPSATCSRSYTVMCDLSLIAASNGRSRIG